MQSALQISCHTTQTGHINKALSVTDKNRNTLIQNHGFMIKD